MLITYSLTSFATLNFLIEIRSINTALNQFPVMSGSLNITVTLEIKTKIMWLLVIECALYHDPCMYWNN